MIASKDESPDVSGLFDLLERSLTTSRAQGEAPPPELAFYGGSFTGIERRLMLDYLNIGLRLYKSGLVSGMRFSTRPDLITGEILDLLSAYPVRTVELGAQSMSKRVLDLSGRGHTPEDTERAAEQIRRRGYSLVTQMMAGLPGDSAEGARETARRLAALEPDGARVYPLVVLPGTALEAMWRKGEYIPLSLDKAADICADIIRIFEQSGVRVIRVGLDTSETLAAEVLAGPYHPAFGHIARSRLWLRAAERALSVSSSGCAGKTAVLCVPAGSASLMAGQGGENIRRLKESFYLSAIRIYEGRTAAEFTHLADQVFIEINPSFW